jgi:4'-phosphopantetheinyl transferase
MDPTAPLGPREVRVIEIALDLAPDESAAATATLAPGERARAARLPPELRQRWIASHAALRTILGAHLGRPPERVEWERSPAGRPEPRGNDLWFSLSRSGAKGLIALARGRPVGVDLERLRPIRGAPEILSLLVTPAERDRIAALPSHRRDREVVSWWTRAEAWVKARGTGLAGLEPLAGAPSADRPARMGRAGAPGRCAVQDLDGIPAFAAAVAAEGEGWRLARSRWSPA